MKSHGGFRRITANNSTGDGAPVMLFAHLKRILRLDRLRCAGRAEPKDEFLLAATAQNLRKLAKLIPLPTPIFAT